MRTQKEKENLLLDYIIENDPEDYRKGIKTEKLISYAESENISENFVYEFLEDRARKGVVYQAKNLGWKFGGFNPVG